MNRLIKITVLKWNEKNPKHKDFYKKTQISNNFCSDAKINAMPMACAWLFLGLLLMCGDHANDTVTITERQVNAMLKTKLGALNALGLLKEYQLVTFEILQPLGIEVKISKDKVSKKNSRRGARPKIEAVESPAPTGSDPPPSAAPPQENTGRVIAAYCDAWMLRYRSSKSPHILGKQAKDIKAFVQQAGERRAIEMLEAYLQMPDSWFLTKRHDIPTFLGNLNAVTQFIETGKMFTRKDAKNIERRVDSQNLLQLVDEGVI